MRLFQFQTPAGSSRSICYGWRLSADSGRQAARSQRVAALLRGKVDVNTAQPDGSTALSWAVYFNDAESVDLLLKAGAKVEAATDYGETALTLAAANGSYWRWLAS